MDKILTAVMWEHPDAKCVYRSSTTGLLYILKDAQGIEILVLDRQGDVETIYMPNIYCSHMAEKLTVFFKLVNNHINYHRWDEEKVA